MPRPVILYSGAFADRPLAELAARAAEWGYAGLELATWGDHFRVAAARSDTTHAAECLRVLSDHDLHAPVLAGFRVGQAVCDRIDERHQGLVPGYVWGDGNPEGVRSRAAAEMCDTIRAAQQLGAAVVSGFTGSAIWSFVNGYPGPDPAAVDDAFREFANRWHPILDVCAETGVRFALEVHPGQVAFDYHTAERALEAVDHRPEFGFCVDPAHFHWQGMDPAAFVRQFGARIYHVHLKDVAIQLDGRNGLLNSCLPYGDPRRGWEFRSPGRGGVDWENFMRALNAAGYEGPLSVDWRDEALERDFGTQEACEFAKRLDYPYRRPGF